MTQSTEEDVFGLLLKAKEEKDGDESLRKLLSHPVLISRAEAISRRKAAKSSKCRYRDAEDFRQDLLLLLWEKALKCRAEHGEASFWEFVNKIAQNIHVSQFRKSKEELKQSEEKSLDEFQVASEEDIHVRVSIGIAMDSLDERQKAVLKLRLDDKTFEEIAEEVPFDIGKSTAHRIVEDIQKIFAEHVDGYKKDKGSKKSRKGKAPR